MTDSITQQESHPLCLDITGVTKRYGEVTAVDQVDLKVRLGEFFGLLGPNGAGKSTLIKMITGLVRPTSGTIRVLGTDVREDPVAIKRQIGLLPEDMNLYERLTGQEFLEFVGRIYALDEELVLDRTQELLSVLDLTRSKDELVIDYSMGMKKKVGLAAALIHNPRILFLDEPFNGVDVVSSRTVRDILKRLVERGVTVFFSSHIMEIVEKLCTRVAIMRQGKIVRTGTVEELRAAHPESEGMDLEELFLKSIGEEGETPGLSWIGEERR